MAAATLAASSAGGAMAAAGRVCWLCRRCALKREIRFFSLLVEEEREDVGVVVL